MFYSRWNIFAFSILLTFSLGGGGVGGGGGEGGRGVKEEGEE